MDPRNLVPSEIAIDRIHSIANERDLDPQDVFNFVLSTGLEFIESGLAPQEPIQDLTRRTDNINTLLHLLGPTVLGLRQQLAYWISQSPGHGQNEDDLNAALERNSNEAWEAMIMEYGILRPDPPQPSSDMVI